MAVDHTPPPAESDFRHTSAIENELPSYRAISSQAVASLVFGVLSILCFASWYFLAFAALAVVFGFQADRNIRRYPDVLTGRTIAQAGVALALMFGLTAVTIATISGVFRAGAAKTFARHYADVLKKGTYDDVLYFCVPPSQRKGKTGPKVVEELKGRFSRPEMMFTEFGQYKILKDRITEGSREDVHFVKLEASGTEGLTPFAAALLEIHVAPSAKEKAAEEFALAFLKAEVLNGKYEWWVDQLRYPYTPASFVVPEKPVDDGHGHGGGGHSHAH